MGGPSDDVHSQGMRVTLQLDAIDWKILSHLQADGRITNVELAKRVGMSPPPCLRRVRALEEAGLVTAYRALLDPKRLGFDVLAFAFVGLGSQAESDLMQFEARVRDWPIVRECMMLSGEVDFLLKCVAKDLASFQHFIINDLTRAANVAHVKTTLAIRVSKDEALVPLT